MSVLTWNINGIRASRVGLKALLDSLDADVVCLQETKVTRDLLDEPTAVVDGYNAYFSFSRVRSGYSGVATYCRDVATPLAAEEGLSGLLRGASGRRDDGSDGSVGCYGDTSEFTADELQALDAEGRAVVTQHRVRLAASGEERSLAIVNVYCPRADPDRPHRGDFKLRFYRLLQARCVALRNSGSHVIVLGDLNTAHRPIDHCDPEDPELFQEHPGRKWLDQFLCESSSSARPPPWPTDNDHSHDGAGGGGGGGGDPPASRPGAAGPRFVDAFRLFHPTRADAFTCWCNVTGARVTNYGTRIDYVLADGALAASRVLSACDIVPGVLGSDHCPVRAALALDFVPSPRRPPLCAHLMPEFAGRQRKLSAFLVKGPADRGGGGGGGGGKPEACSRDSALGPAGRRVDRAANVAGKASPSAAAAKGKRAARESHGAKAKRAKGADEATAVPARGTLLSFLKRPTGSARLDPAIPAGGPAGGPVSCRDKDSGASPEGAAMAAGGAEDAGGAGDTGGMELGGGGPAADPATDDRQPRQRNLGTDFWKSVLKGLPPAPPCRGHGEPCLLRTVKKPGQNFGRRFYVCPRPEGHASNKEARCNSFTWVAKR
ncbi:DNA-(apurinic or apyrimidinic site) endonuclease 2 [Petromyzon marinus]|uniref:DNA-(apurinic or apyrimidinic site) endonuclease 2 n=1 Tax=Petromyzon marinus TaxID=7757 RepID=UPI003F72F348